VKQIKVTKEWAEEEQACLESVRCFLKRWPNGLVVNRRNLYMAAKELPVDDLIWLAHRLLHPSGLKAADYNSGFEKCCEISLLAETARRNSVTGQAKKHAYAKALADAVKLS
jgi:hypothetical protein